MKTYIVGNWKMNFSVGEASLYLQRLLKRIAPARGLEIVVAPSTIALQSLSLQLAHTKSKVKLAAQNFYHKDFGAYTGETSIAQIRSLVSYALVGHSERRYVFHESDKDLRAKVAAALRSGVTPILCIGETESEKTFGETADVIRDQLLGALGDVSAEDITKVIVAYEPVWAISSTQSARLAAPDEVAAAIRLIRSQLRDLYGKSAEADIPVLYGGSVTPDSAGAYLTIPGVNGLLVGKASLISDQFIGILDIAKKVRS